MRHSPVSIVGTLRTADLGVVFQGKVHLYVEVSNLLIIKSSLLHVTGEKVNRLMLLPPSLILWAYRLASDDLEITNKISSTPTEGWLRVEGKVSEDENFVHNELDWTEEDIQAGTTVDNQVPNVFSKIFVPTEGGVDIYYQNKVVYIEPSGRDYLDIVRIKTDDVSQFQDIFDEDMVLVGNP